MSREELNRLAEDLEESLESDGYDGMREVVGEVAVDLRKLAEKPRSLSDGEVQTIMHGIIHDVKQGFTKERIIQFVIANAKPEEVAYIAGQLMGQSLIYNMTGKYKVMPDG